MTISESVDKLCNLALAEVGYTEGYDNYNKYAANPLVTEALGWNAQNQPWCAIYCVAMFIDAFGFYAGCHLMYGCSALCRTQADYYRENASFYSKPQKGDQVFFYYGGDINHTGIVVDVSESNITTVEGNSGDRVATITYRISDSSIAGYGRPNWAIVADDKPDDPVEEERHYPTLQYLDGIGNPLSIVKAWQHLLLCWGYDIGKWGADGEYGVMTMQRTKDLQKRVGIEADGIVGEETWKQGIKIPVGGVR